MKRTFFKPNHKNHKRKDNNMDANEKKINSEEELMNENTPETEAAEQPQEEEKAQEEQELTPEEALKQELEKAQQALDDQKDKYLRLSAEFDNYRKRTLKEKAELILNGGEKSLTSILPVVDDFERALKNMEQATDVAAIREGVELIYNKFITVLGQNGVKAIDTKEKPLDTDFHEAIAVIPAPTEKLKGKILDCVQTGYTLNEKVIRHAKVVVGE
ncbi:MAG: nucleotide exchange factor GrpE [Mediterranea sp.]|nr:nucleotide exchange factor GrpE [Mediterranea sp.]